MNINLKNIAVGFRDKEVLKDINGIFLEGELISIIGPNGTGKTTLIKAISKLIKYEGDISIKDVNGKNIKREKIAYVPQMNNSVTELTVFEVVLLGQIRELSWKVEKKHIDATTKILKELELLHLSERNFSKLSGGQRQLVVLAQALVSKPRVILLDEPTSALDIKHQLQVLEIARKYTKANNAITLLVIHDLALAARYSDKIMLMNDGYVVNYGRAEEVLEEEVIKSVYDVSVDVSRSNKGYITITPIEAC